MNKRNIEAVYPLSPMQQGILFHSIYAPETGVYFEQMTCTLEGELHVPAFEKAWQKMVDRHPILRTSFVWKRLDKTLQVVHKQITLPFHELDWRNLSSSEQATNLKNLLKENRNNGFKLSEVPLLRIYVIRLSENSYQFIWCHHHILLDGWSLPIIIREVFTYYEAFRQEKQIMLEGSRHYRDYIAWLQKQDMIDAEQYWRRQLKDFRAPTSLVVDQPEDGKFDQEKRYDAKQIYISNDTTAGLQNLARQHQITLNTLVQGAWALLLSRYNGDDDIVFGVTVSGRPAELDGVESMVGLFINTLPVRVRIQPGEKVVNWLKRLQTQQLELRQFEYSPLVEIQGWSEIPRDLPLFESILVFENYPVDNTFQQSNTSLSVKNLQSVELTNYPITLVASPGEQLFLKIIYDCLRFSDQSIERMLSHLKNLLEGFLKESEQPVQNVQLLSHDELQQILVDWNNTSADFPADQCMHQLFETQAKQTPEAVALIFENEHMSYAELNRRSNQLAHYLIKYGVGPEVSVAICMERTLEMMVGIMAILKAGGAYVPMDASYPQERLALMMDDSQATVLLTQSQLLDNIPTQNVQVICLDKDWAAIAAENDENLEIDVVPSNLAYVIYTSGSTGKPKGVAIAHRSAVALIDWGRKVYNKDQLAGLMFSTSICFDVSVFEMFVPLCSGGSLVLAENVLQIQSLPAANEVTLISTVPSAMTELLQIGGIPPSVRTIHLAGEFLATAIVNQLYEQKTIDYVFDLYGPSEDTVYSTYTLRKADAPATIGRPVANKRVYLLDKNLQPVPIGVPGQMYLGGIGQSRGYLNRPDLTAEKFIPDAFSGEPGARLYCAGDLARFSDNGEIEFLGRIDYQVKIRGFRIELGEIETALYKHPAIKTVVVVAREDSKNEKKLIAYLVFDKMADKEPTTTELYNFVKQDLPEYMIPATFMVLDEMPLTPSGKINRKALPAPELGRPELEKPYVPPRTATEELLAGIWKQVLGIEQVGIYDNFFELGGHSLLGIRLQSRIRDTFQLELPLPKLFEAPTVSELANVIEIERLAGKGFEAPAIKPISRDQELPLSFAQKRLWFLDQLEPNSSFYNLPTAMRLKGELNVEALEKSINEIIRRHETLRTHFTAVKGKPQQVIVPELSITPRLIDLSKLAQDAQQAKAQQLATEEAQQPFDLSQAPLFRVSLVKLNDAEHNVLFTMHHIISDGWSVGVLVQEVAALYEAISRGEPSSLADLPIQYADFAVWQRDWLQGEILEKQLNYWTEQLKDSPPVLDLPTDLPRPAMQSFRGASLYRKFSPGLLKSLQSLGQREGATLFMILIAAFKTLLFRYTGQNQINVGTPHANRDRIETEDLIGFFVNTLVMSTDLSGHPTFKALLQRVREVAFGAYAHQDVPFETLVDTLHPQRDLSHTPLFQVMFVLQNAPMKSLEMEGLTFESIQIKSGTAKFDLSLVVVESENDLSAVIEYNTDLFYAGTIERMFDHFEFLLENIIANPEQSIATIPLIKADESHQILYEWNETKADFPSDKCMHQWFESLAEQNPDAIALTFAGQKLTYGEFNRRANQMARYLQNIGVGKEDLVGICMERSIEMMIGIMGTLKAGGAFIPLDPAYPTDRLDYMIADSSLSVLLTQQVLDQRLNPQQAKIVCVDSEWEKISGEANDNLNLDINPSNLAYVIYTSGSTGKPKGTMLQHRGWCNLGKAQQLAFGQGKDSRVLQFSALSFDASVWEMVMALLSGAALCLTDREMLTTGQGLLQVLEQNEITMVTLPPSVLAVVPEAELPNLKTIITAGEACSADLVSRWGNGRRFFNAYGPTEITVCASMFLVPDGYKQNPPIGRPIANFQLYVLDANLQPVAKGVPGELCIGGAGLARGYLNRPHLTADKFIPDPFSRDSGARLYRSGDLVRYLPDGNIEFLGRIDHQVKVRGFRIELGEIEAVLKDHSNILDAAAIVREDKPGDKRIVAYLIADAGKELTVGELRSYLRERLPEYMVPSAFMTLDEFPLSPSGKVDRKRLPAPDLSRPELGSEFVAPRNETEEKLASICAELLNLEKVGVYDNFFELGGHSLLATQFIAHIRDDFQVELPLRILFESPTIADLAMKIAESPKLSDEEQISIEASERGEKSIDELLAEIDQLSDEEAEALLAEQKID